MKRQRLDLLRWRVVLVAGALLLACAPRTAQADDESTPVVRFKAPPRGEPVPALRYQFLPPLLDLKPGNAALVYTRFAKFRQDQDQVEKINDGLSVPLDDLPKDEVRKVLDLCAYELSQVAMAARFEQCEWQFPLDQGEPWATRLDEVQAMRQLARVLALEARLHIAEHRYDDACRSLQTGFAMARHVGRAPFLVSGLIGMAIAGMMLDRVEELMRAPDAPNLYWALMALPRPFIDLREGLRTEEVLVELAFPQLKDLEHAQLAPAEWQALYARIEKTMVSLLGPDTTDPGLRGALVAVKLYPRAKAALVARGRPVEQVEAMPVAQVVLLQMMADYNRLRDDVFKWSFVPYAAGTQGRKLADAAVQDAQRDLVAFPVLALQPAITSATAAYVRLDRRIAALAVVEGLRIHAAAHGGTLPASLADVTLAPALDDPSTGRPFVYRVEGYKATIEGPTPLPATTQKLILELELTSTP